MNIELREMLPGAVCRKVAEKKVRSHLEMEEERKGTEELTWQPSSRVNCFHILLAVSHR